MKITWFAHSCFFIENDAGIHLLMDPYDSSTGYEVPSIEADIVTTSHKHGDHANLAMVEGAYIHIDQAGVFEQMGIRITGIAAKHDAQNGAQRGDIIIYVVENDGVRICHLGDLGHRLSKEQIDAIGQVDILMIPVGGFYTIDAQEAVEVVESLKPRVIYPMHYKTEVCPFPIEGEQKFLDLMQKAEYTIIIHNSPIRVFTAEELPRRHAVVVLDHMY